MTRPRLTGERVLSVVAPNFNEGKWRVSEGDGSTFFVSIEDPAFQARIDRGEPFAKGDFLQVILATDYTVNDEGKLQAERRVTSVINHVARDEQQTLFSTVALAASSAPAHSPS